MDDFLTVHTEYMATFPDGEEPQVYVYLVGMEELQRCMEKALKLKKPIRVLSMEDEMICDGYRIFIGEDEEIG